MFSKVLIANRGAISCRIQRTLRSLGVAPVVVHSSPDAYSQHVLSVSDRISLEGVTPAETYLDADRIIAEALLLGAQAVHPGYGFLSENAEFARKCEENGLVFLGPTPRQLEICGLKHLCRDIAREQGVPLLEGSPVLTSADQACEAADAIGYPVMIKSSAGGGGIGMQIAHSAEEVAEKFAQVARLSAANFADDSVFLEKYIQRARHIEVQVFGDGAGNVLALGERDCSAQRRNQKVVEECPAPGLTTDERQALHDAAVRIARSVDYRSAGTVEFLWDDLSRQFYFLEVNARLQVEHGVTEEVWGLDLVDWMVRLGAGTLPALETLATQHSPTGHAIQVRLYAEDPHKDFQPSIGLINHFTPPPASEARCDTWITSGTEISPYYDPMLAKIIVHAEERDTARTGLIRALAETQLYGIETNLRFLSAILASAPFTEGAVHTRFLNDFQPEERRIDLLEAGVETTVQDYPGRLGLWDVGIPPSGPFDNLHFRLANALVGNPLDAAALECSVVGCTLRFSYSTRLALTGADMGATLNGTPIQPNQALAIAPGDVVKLGMAQGAGQRSYIAVEGGLDIATYLGSRSTFRLGKFGGHAARTLQMGDVLHPCEPATTQSPATESPTLPEPVPASFPTLPEEVWNIGVTYGPHGAPEFFTDDDIDNLLGTEWEVHYNSDRTGIRLIGPKPEWARPDGGEAGLHPSNIHDNAYTVGSIDFTGDMPIILGPDGPSLGGFVCPAVVAQAELWKLGQLRAGNKVRFFPISNADAEALYTTYQENLTPPAQLPCTLELENPIVAYSHFEDCPSTTYRQSGDGVLLIEFGEMELDLDLRFRAQALYEALQAAPVAGQLELVPGIRSLQVQYDTRRSTQRTVIAHVQSLENSLPPVAEMEFPSRIVHLPLSWDDPSTQLAIQRYMEIVRPDAPWCPSNIEFIRRINGLESIAEVQRIVYDARYFVMGLGDVYLGAPVATPLDPRHRLVTTKYNPARTWTPENAVGIGGAYMCIYGMEGPGGYQFVGRTLPIWNRYHQTAQFTQPWLLRFFDQIRWFPVTTEELETMRAGFLTGDYQIQTEETTFKVSDYHHFLRDNATDIAAFRTTQQAAFQAERDDWERTGAMNFTAQHEAPPEDTAPITLADNEHGLHAPLVGSLWKVQTTIGTPVTEGDTILILESMKTEFAITAPTTGTLTALHAQEGDAVKAGQLLAVITQE